MTFDPQWYALRVLPQREYVVAYLLRKQGFATFVPTEIRSHKRSSYSNGKAEFAVPLIPGYVFTGFPSEPAWYDILQNDMIIAPEGMDGKPWRLDFVKLLGFFSRMHDGCLMFDEGLRLINIPGRSPVRALTTKTRTISKRKRKEKQAKAEETQGKAEITSFLSRFVYGGTA